MDTGHPSDASRRLVLRVATKALGALALLATAYVLFSSALDRDGRPETERFTVDLAALAPGKVLQVDWNGRSVLVLRRTGAMIEALKAPASGLADPNSSESRQPAETQNRFRSLRPEYLVILGHGTDLGCPVEWAGPETAEAPKPWHGGFRDRCRGSWYDLAGRVYADQPATRNLPVPEHHFSGATVLHLD